MAGPYNWIQTHGAQKIGGGQVEGKGSGEASRTGGQGRGQGGGPAAGRDTTEDKKSVFVENVDYATTKEELESIFKDCGKIVRVTILRDKFTNNPRGLAYVEFEDVESVETAIMLTGTELRNRALRVSQKRTNIKGMGKPKKKPMFQDKSSIMLKGLLEILRPGGRKFGGPKPKG